MPRVRIDVNYDGNAVPRDLLIEMVIADVKTALMRQGVPVRRVYHTAAGDDFDPHAYYTALPQIVSVEIEASYVVKTTGLEKTCTQTVQFTTNALEYVSSELNQVIASSGRAVITIIW